MRNSRKNSQKTIGPGTTHGEVCGWTYSKNGINCHAQRYCPLCVRSPTPWIHPMRKSRGSPGVVPAACGSSGERVRRGRRSRSIRKSYISFQRRDNVSAAESRTSSPAQTRKDIANEHHLS
ncbi:hypothetical protein F4X10_08145 [Candidatus Poribacteria bacterium]|nr:hypothetical protein [Candidatus Poribacteria bacterium]